MSSPPSYIIIIIIIIIIIKVDQKYFLINWGFVGEFSRHSTCITFDKVKDWLDNN